MFHPNSKPNFHHRGTTFHSLMRNLDSVLHERFEISRDWSLAFITGSGELALEACIASATRAVTPLFPEKEFGRRLAELTFEHNKHGLGTEDVCYVQYETADSFLNTTGWKAKGITIVDCVSSFPYYDPPSDADVWVTVSGKQLGGSPGIAIVAASNEVLASGFFKQPGIRSCLNLTRYFQYKLGKEETPNTPAILVMVELYNSLVGFGGVREYREFVDWRWNRLCEELGKPPYQNPPVYSFRGKIPHDVSERLGLYGKATTQIFLWNGSAMDFEILLEELKELKHEMPGASFWWT